jgi:hypothetical protein
MGSRRISLLPDCERGLQGSGLRAAENTVQLVSVFGGDDYWTVTFFLRKRRTKKETVIRPRPV